MKIRLGMKIGGGFGVLILIVILLGGLAVFNMMNIKKQSEILAKEYVPQARDAGDIQGQMFLVAYNVRGFYLSDAENYLKEANTYHAKVLENIKKTEVLAANSKNLTKLSSDLKDVKENIDKYWSLFNKLVEASKNRAIAFNDIVAQGRSYVSMINDYLTEQYNLGRTELKEQNVKAIDVSRRFDRIEAMTEALNIGLTARLMVATGIAMKDTEMIKKAAEHFDKSKTVIDNVISTTTIAKNKELLAKVKANADNYKNGLANYLKLWDERVDLAKQLVPQGILVLDLCSKVANDGMRNTEQVSNDAVKTLKTSSITIATGLLIAVVISIIVAIVITKLITTPVLNTVNLASAMAKGDMTQRLEIKSNDEIADMSRALNTTCEQLSKVIGDIQKNSETLASASEEVSAISTQLASGSEQMTSQATTIASATEEMSANIKTVDEATNKMNRNVQTVSAASTQISQSMSTVAAAVEQSQANVASMASASEEMTSTIAEIARNTEKANETTNNAVKSVEYASKQVGELASASQEIEQIISVIVDIAEQTKLLALNATIEAARAGEAGKGFAVVANEVKDLAKQTNEATEDIKKRVIGMQDSTKTTVEQINKINGVIQEVNSIVGIIAAAVEEQNVTMKENAKNVSQVSEGIQEVTRNVTEVNHGVGDIAKSISEVADGANNVAKSAGEASVGANDVAKNITGISQAAGESSKGAQQLNTAAGDLAKMASSLQEMVKKFKV